MKRLNFFIFLLMFFSLFVVACSSSKTKTDEDVSVLDSDKIVADNDSLVLDKDNVVSDVDVAEQDVENQDSSDVKTDEDINENVCANNPCNTAENQKTHKTKCMPEPKESVGYKCVCDVTKGFHTSTDDVCCPLHSDSINGNCECVKGYVHPKENPEQCVAKCSQDTIAGLNGYCEDGKICQQGKCIDDKCKDFKCPDKSDCTVKNDAPFCQCDDGLHMSNNICCQEHASNVGGKCACDKGFEEKSGKCVPSSTNKCYPNPCLKGPLHKDKCVQDTTAQGYHCECNDNYELNSNGACRLKVVDECPLNLQCLNGYCVPLDLSNEQCITDEHCREFPGAKTVCSAPNAAGGVCSGCTTSSDCPGNTQCMDNGYGTCALMCDDDNDCPYGKCYSTGYCGQKKCYSNEDCFGGTICVDSDGDGKGMCQRIECKETQCSSTNPNGTCKNSNEACIDGKCVSSCDSNPCQNIKNTECKEKLGVPYCACEKGTVADENGHCVPEVVDKCPTNFECVNSRCVDKSDKNFVCGENSDCKTGLTCSNALPSGSCQGCMYKADCNKGLDCIGSNPSTSHKGFCVVPCSLPTDCGTGMTCKKTSLGNFCSKINCVKTSDCPNNYVCSASGRCERIPCK